MKIFVNYTGFAILLFYTVSIAAQPKTMLLTHEIKKHIIDTICKELKENYVYADTSIRMGNYLKSQLKAEPTIPLQNAQAFSKKLTDDVWSVYHDRHFSIRYSPRIAEVLARSTIDSNEEEKRQQAFGRTINYGFSKVEILDGNIGYIKLNGFWGLEQESKQTANAAITFVSHCNALVFDLRENFGGQPEMVQYIASFLFKDSTHLNDLYVRASNHVESFWTSPDTLFGTLFNVPVYVLTSKTTFSGGEEFAYDLQTQKRAIIVGETTGGGAHPVQPFIAGYGFIVNIPFARAINPVTKSNWEATGVHPDIPVSKDKSLGIVLDKIKSTSAANGDSYFNRN